MRKRWLSAALGLGVWLASANVEAFCGFYVSGADAKLYNNATQVVLLRDGPRTVLSMQNNYQGPPENFAMVTGPIDNDDGTTTPIASETIHVYDVTHTTALSDAASDSDGHVAGASVAVAVGTLLRFSFSRANGLCGFSEQLTT